MFRVISTLRSSVWVTGVFLGKIEKPLCCPRSAQPHNRCIQRHRIEPNRFIALFAGYAGYRKAFVFYLHPLHDRLMVMPVQLTSAAVSSQEFIIPAWRSPLLSVNSSSILFPYTGNLNSLYIV